MVSKPVWYCREVGIDGIVAIHVDVDLGMSSGTCGYARHLHPFELDNAIDPRGMFLAHIEEMTRAMGALIAPEHPASRACAFANHQEQQP